MQAAGDIAPDVAPRHTHRPARHRQRTRRTWRAWVGGIVIAVLAALFVGGAVLVTVQHVKLEPVLSGSMRPGIQPGDLAVIKPVPVKDLRVGDVIAYLPPHQSTPVMHRIISIDSAGIVTKGDANNVADPWGRVKPQDPTVERLVVVIPKVGFLTNIKRTLFIVAGILLLIVAVVALWPDKRPSEKSGPDNANDSTHDSSGPVDDDRDATDKADSPAPELTQSKGE